VLGIGLATSTFGVVGGILVSLVVAMLVCGVLNVMIERVAYRPLRSAPKLAPLITAVGMSFVPRTSACSGSEARPPASTTSSTPSSRSSRSPASRCSGRTCSPSP